MHFTKELNVNRPPNVSLRKFVSLFNFALMRMGWKITLQPAMDHATIMVSPLQRLNFMHLIDNVLFNKVKGSFAELGCYEGQTGILIQQLLDNNHSDRQLYLYDNFQHQIGLNGNIRERLLNNFKEKKLKEPILVEGNFEETLPGKLPAEIAFMHIDCGYGGNHDEHKKVVLHCLESCYPRMSPGAVGILSDYHDKELTVDGFNSNPGVKMACDIFFKDKPEQMFVLYGGDYSHGYFRKSIS